MKSLSFGALPEYLSEYIKNLIDRTGGANGPIGKQFLLSQNSITSLDSNTSEYDPQEEESYEVAPGIIYKYRGKLSDSGSVVHYGRVLWTISRYCATYCRFCFRGRFVGLPAVAKGIKKDAMSKKPFLNSDEIESCIKFISEHKEINEVILSGGDPFVVPEKYFGEIVDKLAKLQNESNIDIIRFHTRAPVTNPFHIKPWHYETIKKIKLPYIVLHVNHEFELTPEVCNVIESLRESGAILLSQSVLLKGVNDSVESLQNLFNQLVKNGVIPYYLHQNDPVTWAEEFTVPIDEAIEIWKDLRPRLSGLAAQAKFVIDTPHGFGKVSIPEAGWNVDYSHFYDFKGVEQKLK